MQGGRKFIKKLILAELVIVIYIILTSSIIGYHYEKKVASILINSVIGWSTNSVSLTDQMIQREKTLVSKVDDKLSARLSGAILLQIESMGEAWYVYPEDLKKYYLDKSDVAYETIKELGIEIESEELIKILYFDKIFPENLAGLMVINKQDNREIYYVNPKDRWGHLLKSPEEALSILATHGIGITNKDIRKIEVGILD